MAFSTLPKPGSKFGPCKKACQHKDCAATRKQSETLCPGCGDAIGFDTPFVQYSDDITTVFGESDLWHQSCLETKIELDREKAEAQ